MSGEWVGQRQEYWQELARTEGFSLWQRVLFAAWGNARRNRHANFTTRGLAEAVAVRPEVEQDGQMVALPPALPDEAALRKAVRHLKTMKLLDPSSKLRCLVIPAPDLYLGPGSQRARCLLHD